MSSNPFGSEITGTDILEDLEFFDDWEDRYRYIIDLGKKLPTMPDELKTDLNFVHGCQSQVWISHQFQPDSNTLHFLVDSDAHIVRGLAAMVMAAFNQKPPRDILDFDIEGYFGKTQLIQHLSPTRGNGLKSMVNKIREAASAHR
ncbi:SufE family protein [Ketobacter sp. MCCC 1A13808]|uniref:SufE family protein n=1 Tax=Ketobacter sp. MCCC 1A13808 TaxID=2602738 RepID=UPI0012EB595A|nr:SufE family protein [Ketobacter sp. MCCC 1A13808]MVF11681.1 SufE family protein [Ketobacter sp. MCCC 1A13808]